MSNSRKEYADHHDSSFRVAMVIRISYGSRSMNITAAFLDDVLSLFFFATLSSFCRSSLDHGSCGEGHHRNVVVLSAVVVTTGGTANTHGPRGGISVLASCCHKSFSARSRPPTRTLHWDAAFLCDDPVDSEFWLRTPSSCVMAGWILKSRLYSDAESMASAG